MAYTQEYLRGRAREIVRKSKAEAHVDTGYLKRSINYVINERGIFEFTSVFYGQFHENSTLEENIKSIWPHDMPYTLIYTDDNGYPYQVVKKTSAGRTSVSNNTKKSVTRSIGIGGIKDFLKRLADGKKKNESPDTSGQDNKG